MTGAKVGAVIAQVAAYNRVDAEPTVEALLSGISAAERVILPGGVQASAGEREINPGCCCGLEGWREWLTRVGPNDSPWTGHDPAPLVERDGDVVRVWSDGGLSQAPDAFAIEFEQSRFASELGRVELELRELLQLVGEWAR